MPILQRPEWDRPAGGEGKPPSGWRGFLCRVGMHDWDEVHNTGYTAYLRCERCGRRDIAQVGGGHQPVHREWITKGEYPFPDWGNIQLPTGSAGKPPSPIPQPTPPRPPTVGLLNLDNLQNEVRAWTREAFPHSTQVTRARHLLREATELYAAARLSEIVADNDDAEVLYGRLVSEIDKETHATASRIVFPGYAHSPGDIGEEMADCLLILCDMAAAATDLPGMEAWSLYMEAHGKLQEVKQRQYGKPDSSGVTEHVRDGEQSA